MIKDKLYAVMNEQGQLLDLDYVGSKLSPTNEVGCLLTTSKDEADQAAKLYGARTMVLTNGKPEKELVSEEEASLLGRIKDGLYKSNTLAIHDYLALKGKDQSVTKARENHLMRALVHGYTTKEEKQYIIYKKLPGNKFVQAYKQDYAECRKIDYYVFDKTEFRYGARYYFTDEEIEQYGLQDFTKEQVEDY